MRLLRLSVATLWAAGGPVMTEVDRVGAVAQAGDRARMVRSDYGRLVIGRSELPGPLSLTSTFPFVGRSSELATLRTLMPWAEGEGRRVVLVGGEAGSGKSRLVREFAGEAAAGGALVLYGACDAVVHPPYGPFVQALDHLARVSDPAELRAALGTTGGELARLLPDLEARTGAPALPVD